MYDYIKGEIISKQLTTSKGASLIIEANSIGYCVLTNDRVINSIDDEKKIQKIYTSLIHKEDVMSLCGFLTSEQRDIFNILQSVSGIGVKVALTLLNEFSIEELILNVLKENSKEIAKTKGIGIKLAQKIILELKDKLINWQKNALIDLSEYTNITVIQNENLEDAQAVLSSFGYSKEEIKSAIANAISKNMTNSEDILKTALSFLSSESF